MIVRVEPTVEAVAEAAAGVVAAAIGTRDRLVLGLPTGRTPIGLYARLRARPIDWRRVVVFNLDELVGLPASDPRSYRGFMRQHLFDAVGLAGDQVHCPDGLAADPAAECARYDAALTRAGGLDLLVCGVGANGHLAFNEPGETLTAAAHVATLQPGTRLGNVDAFGGDLSAVPTQALTLGMAAILGARRVLVLATGAAKADVVAAMIAGPLTTRLPASWLQVHPRVEVLLDAAAAAKRTR